ncbi:hypothetical protein [Aliiroseovarius crassostreae]|uniref:3'-5' exonuclease n=1 Tax=Aliiroseovarius crassostreae TaxID=154981 RepID=UPI00220A4A93|nr:hypothetical protein [Aliiroseovarius crassostreae]UWQ04932.1 hypothetical protein K3X22_00145 [Aliiroseovarius crassostreae]
MTKNLQNLVFIDFEASSLSSDSWPIEVGVAWLEGKKVISHSKMIRPRASWSLEDWSDASAKVHGISQLELEMAEDAGSVAGWLVETVDDRVLVSDAPEFDQRWLNRLLGEKGPLISDFDQLAWSAFSDNGLVNPGRFHRVYRALSQRSTAHRAGDDAAGLCYAWRAGVGK